MTTPDGTDNTLSLHVFGSSQGESVVVQLPGGRWGLVDCYASNLADPTANPILQFLRDNRVRELEFICLTHPHEDHYRGMSQILQAFPVGYFWRPAALSGRYLQWLLRHEHGEGRKSAEATVLGNASELEAIFMAVLLKHQAKERPMGLKQAALNTALYPVPDDEPHAKVRIRALAPSGRQSEIYQQALAQCFEKDRLKKRLPHGHQNIISIALLIEFGKTRVLLGGDVEKASWLDVIAEYGASRLPCCAVKVSHHGSTTGYCDGLWAHLARAGRPIAVLTAFRHHRLPRQEALNHIKEHASRVLTPNLLAAQMTGAIPSSIHAPVESRQAIAAAFKATRPDKRTGRCLLVFDDLGNCVGHDAPAPAGDL